MSKMTLQTRYAKGLESIGFREAKRTSRYLVFSSEFVENIFFYLGASGSVRKGRNRTTCVPVSEQFKARLLTVTAHLA